MRFSQLLNCIFKVPMNIVSTKVMNETVSKYSPHKRQDANSSQNLVNICVLGQCGEEWVMLFNELWLYISEFPTQIPNEIQWNRR